MLYNIYNNISLKLIINNINLLINNSNKSYKNVH